MDSFIVIGPENSELQGVVGFAIVHIRQIDLLDLGGWKVIFHCVGEDEPLMIPFQSYEEAEDFYNETLERINNFYSKD